jgi:hypothetical protein
VSKLVVFYHTRFSGGEHPPTRHGPATPALNTQHALRVVEEQMNQLRECGLADAAEVVIGLNGGLEDYKTLRRMTGFGEIVVHGEQSAGEFPTLELLYRHCVKNPQDNVLYFHAKGVCWPGDPFREAWRRCLMYHVVMNWELLCGSLNAGCRMAGAHWLTPQDYPEYRAVLGTGIWGGNFWGARADYINMLKPIPPNRTWDDKYDAEMWPVSGRPQQVMCFASHWPSLISCGQAKL